MDLGITLGLVGILLSILLWLIKPTRLENIFKPQNVTGFMKSKGVIDNFTIAIIDDELDSYPIHYIQNLGYLVKTFESVSFSQAKELSKFDLILLDVKGVVKEDLKEGGAKLIKLLKEERPLLPIVAVSSGFFHTELNDYFKTCDDYIKKPIDEFRIREIIAELKLKYYDESNIAKLINDDIQALQISQRKKRKLSSAIIKYLNNDIKENDLKIHLHKIATTKTDGLLLNIRKLKSRLTDV